MKIRKQVLRKIMVGVLLLTFSVLTTFVLKSVLMAQNPEYALPVVRVECNGEGLPAENQMLESYSWQFLTIVKSGQLRSANTWQDLPAAWEPPNAPLEIKVSFPAKEMTISRTEAGGTTFTEVGGELRTPPAEGIYTYRVTAAWGQNKSIVYYFKLHIPPA